MTNAKDAFSPVPRLLAGLILTLFAVVAYSWYIAARIADLRAVQTELTDRNRRDSLQLLRIQNDLNTLGLAMRDMLDPEEHYKLTAWSAQFDRIRTDLGDALKKEADASGARRTPEQRRYLEDSVAQFFDASQRIFELAAGGREEDARAEIRLSLQARQAALATAVARLLVQNNEAEERTAQDVQNIYVAVQRRVYLFLAATLLVIAATSLYLMRANRRLFARMARLSDERRELTQQILTAREETLKEISRELHDEFGQLLTAIGTMLGRVTKQAPADSPLAADLREISEIAQTALDRTRGLAQTLHPSLLEELGLDSTVEWYLSTVERQFGVQVTYARTGTPAALDQMTTIHVYRVLQEAMNNVARHSGTRRVWVRLDNGGNGLRLEVEDHGTGVGAGGRRGLGLVTMRERAALIGGTLQVLAPEAGGTLVRLAVPQRRASTA
ncbi:MAG TPA: ATP-binding protein [Vicinamibacterales bacterium]|jgi:signal transduction histidine kinase